MAACSHNQGIELFVEVFNRVAMLYSAGWQHFGLDAETVRAHARIAEAILDGDAATAQRRVRAHLEAEATFLRTRRSTRQLLPDAILADHGGSGKLAEAVARRMVRLMVASDLQPGDLVGTETGLIEREGVSRAVFREAVRILEHHQIAGMKRGPGGGLVVMEPDSGAVTDVVAIYLARGGMRLSQLSEFRNALELELTGLAVDRLDGPGRGRVTEALERELASSEEERGRVVHDLHVAVAQAASSFQALELVARVLIRLSRLHQIEKLATRDIERIRAEVLRTHTAIASALLDGDGRLARHRMGKHLEALALYVR